MMQKRGNLVLAFLGENSENIAGMWNLPDTQISERQYGQGELTSQGGLASQGSQDGQGHWVRVRLCEI